MQKIDAIAFPGMTANFDAAKPAALAMSLLDWREHGKAYGEAMIEVNTALANELEAQGLQLFKVKADDGRVLASASHQFALEAGNFGGGQSMAKQLRSANILSCGIGLPVAEIENDMNGLRLGTPEIVRTGMTAEEMPEVAEYIADSLFTRRPAGEIAYDVSKMRSVFKTLRYIDS